MSMVTKMPLFILIKKWKTFRVLYEDKWQVTVKVKIE